jgi:hypothetical protein
MSVGFYSRKEEGGGLSHISIKVKVIVMWERK